MMQSWKPGSRGTQVLKMFKREYENISCVLIDDQSQYLFVGAYEDNLNQIDLRSKKMIKIYTKLRIGEFRFMSSFGKLISMRGYDNYLKLINIVEKRVVTVKKLYIYIRQIDSVQFNVISRNNMPTVTLTVSGGKPLFYL